ncbi:MAG: TadE/TadG family type IV pilus assembly protein [Pseudomonadota bacterium]
MCAFRGFLGDRQGSVAVIFGITSLILFGATALAVDFAMANRAKSRMQAAADAAALTAASLLEASDSERQARGEAVFLANLDPSIAATLTISVVDGIVSAAADYTMPTNFMRIFERDELQISVNSASPVVTQGEAEIVLVLDFSDSMNDANKHVRMKEAAAKLIDVISDNGKNSKVKVGLVPFAAMVHVDLDPADIRADVTWSGCTQDRRHPANTTDEAPSGINDTRWGEVTSPHVCADMAARGLKVVPLSSDLSTVKSKLAAMQPYMWTHIALGAEFGYQLISPGEPFTEGVGYDDERTVKAFVLLTDGMQTAPGWGADGIKSVANAEQNLLAICSGLKGHGVQVYTIGYDLTDAATLDRLQTCADSGRYYNAGDVDTGLLASFGAIAQQIKVTMLRLTK